MPQPSTTGGALMSYPSTVDTGQIQPLALYSDDISVATTATALTAGAAYFSELRVFANVPIVQLRCVLSGTPTGNIDMGIYDAAGTNGAPLNLLGHTGAILSATGLFTQNLLATTSLAPGIYWLAYLNTVADSVLVRSGSAVGGLVAVRTSVTNLTVLPASLGSVINNQNRVGIMALRSGGFS